MQEYQIIQSKRKTIALEVTRELKVLVRAPNQVPQREIEAFVLKHEEWISRSLARMAARRESRPEPAAEEAQVLAKLAGEVLPSRVAYYSQLMQLYPSQITITSAKTRFGSCSGKNRICFSWRLMQYPPEAIDYVVVHELAHIVHKNHSKQFYALVAQYLPDWKLRRQLLR